MRKLFLVAVIMIAAVTAVVGCGEENGDNDVIAINIAGHEQMYVGDSQTLEVTASKNGEATVYDSIYLLENNGVAELSGTTITAKKSGLITVEAKLKDTTASKVIKVLDAVDLRFGESAYHLKSFDLSVNNAVELDYSGIMNNAALTSSDVDMFEWKSSDENIATVDQGIVTFKTGGKIKVTVLFGGNLIAAVDVECTDYSTYTVINTAAELRAIPDYHQTDKWILGQDIDLNGETLTSYLLRANFIGILDGNGHKIHNFSLNGQWRALIGTIGNDSGGAGIVRNLTVEANEFTTNTQSAILATAVQGSGSVIDNCVAYVHKANLTATLTASQNGSGFLVANVHNGATIRNSAEIVYWGTGDKVIGVSRIGYKQNTATYSNNLSIMVNMPVGISNYDKTNNMEINYFQPPITMLVGDELMLSAMAGYSVIAASGDTEVAVVDNTGKVTAVSQGDTELNITFEDYEGWRYTYNGTEITLAIKVSVLSSPSAPTSYSFNHSVISWESVYGAVEYTVSIQKDDETAAEVATLTNTSYDIAGHLDGAGEYTVRVKAIDRNGGTQGYSTEIVINTIASVDDFAKIAQYTDIDAYAGNWLLINDIDLDGAERTTYLIGGRFVGVLDGGGYKIHNFTITTGQRSLIRVLGVPEAGKEGQIRNLSVFVNEYSTGAAVAILAYAVNPDSIIENCLVYAHKVNLNSNLTAGDSGAGFLAARVYNRGIIKNNIEVAIWNSGNKVSGVTRMGYGSELSVFTDNKSLMINMPVGLGNSDTVNTKELNYTYPNVDLIIGGTAQLPTLDGYTLSFTANDTNIATVDSLGNITAVAEGNTYITATVRDSLGATLNYNGTNITFNIAVKVLANLPLLDAPSDYTYNKSVVSWEEVAGAVGYVVSIAKNGAAAEEISNITANEFDISPKLSGAGAYEIKVKSINASQEAGTYGNGIVINALSDSSGFATINAFSSHVDNQYAGNWLLINDIDLGGQTITQNLVGGRFVGVLDGNGYKIHNFKVTGKPIFNVIGVSASPNRPGTIRNLVLECEEYTTSALAVLADGVNPTSTIDNVSLKILKANFNTDYEFGFLVRINYSNAIVKNCTEIVYYNSGDKLSSGYAMGKDSAGSAAVYNNNLTVLINTPASVKNSNSVNNKIVRYSDISSLVGGVIEAIPPLADYEMDFVSGDDNVVTITQQGEITVVAQGTTYIEIVIRKGNIVKATVRVAVSIA